MTAYAVRIQSFSLTSTHLAVLGLLLGLFAFYVALPPIDARSPVWSFVFGALGAVAGLVAWRLGSVRGGWSAVALGILGAALGYLATRSSVENLEIVFGWPSLIASMLVFATPLVYAAVGGIFSERSGVVNIGLEGMMLMGAFWGIWGADTTGSWITGVLIGMAAGGSFGLLHAIFSIHLRADQIVGGTAVNLLAIGVTGYAFVQLYGSENIPSGVSDIPRVRLEFLDSIPPDSLGNFLFGAFGRLSVMIWLGFLLVVVAHVVLFKTPIGLRIRASGEHPRAADTVGINVYGMRYAAVTLSGVLAGAGGAFLSVGVVSSFNENMTAGRGFIALAAMIFGRWSPIGALFAALLFGFANQLQGTLGVIGTSIPSEFMLMAPYLATIFAVAGLVGRVRAPAADGQPYVKA